MLLGKAEVFQDVIEGLDQQEMNTVLVIKVHVQEKIVEKEEEPIIVREEQPKKDITAYIGKMGKSVMPSIPSKPKEPSKDLGNAVEQVNHHDEKKVVEKSSHEGPAGLKLFKNVDKEVIEKSDWTGEAQNYREDPYG